MSNPVEQHLLEGTMALRTEPWINTLRNNVFISLGRYSNSSEAGQKKAAIYEFCTSSLFPSWIALQEKFIQKIQQAKLDTELKPGLLQREIYETQNEAIKLLEGFCKKVEEVFPGTFYSDSYQELNEHRVKMIREMGLSSVPFFVFLMRSTIKAVTMPTIAKYNEVTTSQSFVINLTSKATKIAQEIWNNSPGNREFPLSIPQEA